MTLKQRIGRVLDDHLPVSKRLFDQLRFEFRVARERWKNRLLPWRRARISALRKRRGLSVNVGSGGRGLPGWINFDATANHGDIYCTHDLREPLPLADGSVRRILAEHVVEHIDFYRDVPRVFRDFHRSLEPGGVVRIIVPDVGKFVRAYVSGSRVEWAALGFAGGELPTGMTHPIEVLNHVFVQGGEHFFGWDYATMEHALRQAGFAAVHLQSFGVSVDPELAIDQPNHAPYSLYVDAVKAAA